MHIEQVTQDNLFSTVEIEDYDVRINGKYFFDQPINNELRTYDIIIKNAIGQGNDHTTGCLLDYPYFKKYYQVIAINLSKQQALDFTGKLDRAGNNTTFSVIEVKKKLFWIFPRQQWKHYKFILLCQILLVILIMTLIFHLNCY